MTHHVLHRSIETVAEKADNICEMVREIDGARVLADLTKVCEKDPAKAAQYLMALAAWVDVDEPLSARHARVAAITAPRMRVAV